MSTTDGKKKLSALNSLDILALVIVLAGGLAFGGYRSGLNDARQADIAREAALVASEEAFVAREAALNAKQEAVLFSETELILKLITPSADAANAADDDVEPTLEYADRGNQRISYRRRYLIGRAQ